MNQKALLTVSVLIIVLLVAGGFLLANRAGNNSQAPSQAEQTEEVVSPIEEESPTETEEVQNEVVVTLTTSGFSPKTITINAGDKVIWENQSGETATVHSAPHPIHTAYPKLNLGNFEDGETHELIFPDSGTYNYHNHLNASQTGRVVVE